MAWYVKAPSINLIMFDLPPVRPNDIKMFIYQVLKCVRNHTFTLQSHISRTNKLNKYLHAIDSSDEYGLVMIYN